MIGEMFQLAVVVKRHSQNVWLKITIYYSWQVTSSVGQIHWSGLSSAHLRWAHSCPCGQLKGGLGLAGPEWICLRGSGMVYWDSGSLEGLLRPMVWTGTWSLWSHSIGRSKFEFKRRRNRSCLLVGGATNSPWMQEGKNWGHYLHSWTTENLGRLSSHGKHLSFRWESNININIMCERSSYTQFRNNLVY